MACMLFPGVTSHLTDDIGRSIWSEVVTLCLITMSNLTVAQREFVWTLFHSQCTQLIVAAVIVLMYCLPIYILCQSNIDAPLTHSAPIIVPVALAAVLFYPRCPKMIPNNNVSQESWLTHRQIRRGRCWPWTEGMPRVRSKGANLLSLFCV